MMKEGEGLRQDLQEENRERHKKTKEDDKVE